MARATKRAELYESGTLSTSTNQLWRNVRSPANSPVVTAGYTCWQAPLGNGDASDAPYPLGHNPGMVAKVASTANGTAWMRPGLDGVVRYWELTSLTGQPQPKFYDWGTPWPAGNTQAQNRAATVGCITGVYRWDSARTIASNQRINKLQIKQAVSYFTNAQGFPTGGGNSDPIFEIAAMRRSDAGGSGAGPRAVFRHANDFSQLRAPECVIYHGSNGGSSPATPVDIPLDVPYALALVFSTTGVHPYFGAVVYSPFSVVWTSLTNGVEVGFSHIGADSGGFDFGNTGRRACIDGAGNYGDTLGRVDLLDYQTTPTQAPSLLPPYGQSGGGGGGGGSVVVPQRMLWGWGS